MIDDIIGILIGPFVISVSFLAFWYCTWHRKYIISNLMLKDGSLPFVLALVFHLLPVFYLITLGVKVFSQ